MIESELIFQHKHLLLVLELRLKEKRVIRLQVKSREVIRLLEERKKLRKAEIELEIDNLEVNELSLTLSQTDATVRRRRGNEVEVGEERFEWSLSEGGRAVEHASFFLLELWILEILSWKKIAQSQRRTSEVVLFVKNPLAEPSPNERLFQGVHVQLLFNYNQTTQVV